MSERKKKLQFNPDPLKVVSVPKCARCHHFAPWCKCYKNPDYRWPDGSKA